MALLLNIDTSTTVCSVVLAKNGEVQGIKESAEGLNHSLLLGTYIDELLKENNITVQELDAIAVSMGPGSYTGLRIGVSMAKGLCYGGNISLIAVNTLQALAFAVSDKVQDAAALYCPMIDARRMEVYTALLNVQNEFTVNTKAEIIDENSFQDVLKENKIYFFGNGSSKVKTLIQSAHAEFIDNIQTSASNMIKIAEEKFQKKDFEDVAYFEPFYLKNFVATTPKNKI